MSLTFTTLTATLRMPLQLSLRINRTSLTFHLDISISWLKRSCRSPTDVHLLTHSSDCSRIRRNCSPTTPRTSITLKHMLVLIQSDSSSAMAHGRLQVAVSVTLRSKVMSYLKMLGNNESRSVRPAWASLKTNLASANAHPTASRSRGRVTLTLKMTDATMFLSLE